MSNVKQLPDLARMRALSDLVRGLPDEGMAGFLCTEDGQWLFVECSPYLDADVCHRIVEAVVAGLPAGTLDGLLK